MVYEGVLIDSRGGSHMEGKMSIFMGEVKMLEMDPIIGGVGHKSQQALAATIPSGYGVCLL